MSSWNTPQFLWYLIWFVHDSASGTSCGFFPWYISQKQRLTSFKQVSHICISRSPTQPHIRALQIIVLIHIVLCAGTTTCLACLPGAYSNVSGTVFDQHIQQIWPREVLSFQIAYRVWLQISLDFFISFVSWMKSSLIGASRIAWMNVCCIEWSLLIPCAQSTSTDCSYSWSDPLSKSGGAIKSHFQKAVVDPSYIEC